MSGWFRAMSEPGDVAEVPTGDLPPARPPRTTTAGEISSTLSDILNEVQTLRATQTETAAFKTSQLVNGVLVVEQFTFDSTATQSYSFRAPVGSIIIHNISGSHSLTYQVGPNALDTPPTGGKGVQTVPSGSRVSIAVGTRAFVLYGTTGEDVCVQAFTGLQAFGIV